MDKQRKRFKSRSPLGSHHNILGVVSEGRNAAGKKIDLMDIVKEEPTGLDT